ncbi:MAG: T9SS type A sorting domain-containing protein [Bacteroidales bacterium]|jgi:hypothetical protein|nr:T9SS type A sorting domain-containing protein [Bacteroidales bacterium]
MYQINNPSTDTFSAMALRPLLILFLLTMSFCQLMAQTITVTYTESGNDFTFTVPCNATSVKGEAWGGGGGGGNAAGSFLGSGRGGGGGGGAYTIKNWGTIGGSTFTLSVGSSGQGGQYSFGSTNGSAGGASTITCNSTVVTANGGSGGSGTTMSTGSGGGGGSWSNGDSGIDGTGGATGGSNGGNGGAGGNGASGSNDGGVGNPPGGGGGGARYGGSAGGKSGGNGARGQIILTFTLPTISIASSNPNLCVGDLLSVVDPCPDITYIWKKNGVDITTGTTYIPTEAGTYTVVAAYTYSGGNPSITGNNPSNELVIKPHSVINSFEETICDNNTITITPIDGIDGLVLAGTTYTWTVIDADEVQNAETGSGSSFNSGQLVHNTTDLHTVIYQVIPTTDGCVGNTFNISANLKPTSSINPTFTEILCNNDFDEPIVITPIDGTDGRVPAGTTYTWTVETIAEMNATAGSGSSFNSGLLVNNTTDLQTAIYDVTSITDGCAGEPFEISISLKPTSSINPITDTICNNGITVIMPIDGENGRVMENTNYIWTVTDPELVLNTSGGSGKLFNSGQLENNTINWQTVVYEVTPVNGDCSGDPFTISITVKPNPVINSIKDTICNNNTTTVIPTDGINGRVPANTTYTWTVTDAGLVENTAAGEGNWFNNGPLMNNTTDWQTAIYEVTPATDGCMGDPFMISVTVKLNSVISSIADTICNNGSIVITPIDGENGNTVLPGTTYTWTVSDAASVLNTAAGSGNSFISGALENKTIYLQTAVYEVTPITNGCAGEPFEISVTVKPSPSINTIAEMICNDSTVTIMPINGTNGRVPENTTYTWTVINAGLVLNTAAGSGNSFNNGPLVNNTTGLQTATYKVTPTTDNCVGNPFTLSVSVKPSPNIDPITDTICSNNTVTIMPTNGTNGRVPANTTYKWTVNDPGLVENIAAGSGNSFNSGLLENNTTGLQTAIYDVIPATNGCPGDPFTISATLKLADYTDFDTVRICENGLPLQYGSVTFPAGTVTGDYPVHFDPVIHCDSIIVLHIVVNPIYNDTAEIEVCRYATVNHFPESFMVNQDTIVSYLYQSALGCDSLVTLKVKAVYFFMEQTIEICSNDSYYFDDKNLTETGVYLDTLSTTALGCDSIIQLNLIVKPAYFFEEEAAVFIHNQPYSWHGNDYQNLPVGQHIFYDSLNTVLNCDSIYKLTLSVSDHYETRLKDTACFGTLYEKHGFSVKPYTTGLWLDTLTLTAQLGCDSLIYLSLWVNVTDTTEITDEICLGNIYSQHGFNVVADAVTTLYDTLIVQNRFGCDSVLHLILTVNPTYAETYYDTICKGQGYNRYNFSYNDADFNTVGDFQFVQNLHALNGCDSIRTLYLHVNPTYTNLKDTIVVCASELPLYTGNRILFSSNTYLVNYTTACGCDSVVWLTLHVIPQHTLLTAAVCAGEPYLLNGFSIPIDSTLTAGQREYVKSLTSVTGGCDSTVTLQLTVLPVYHDTITASVCLGNRYSDHGFDLLPASTDFLEMTQNLTTVNGCDSIITLKLTVKPSFLMEDAAAICSNAIPYLWRNQSYTQSGDYYDSLQTTLGCDSIFVLHLTVNNAHYDTVYAAVCAPDVYEWRGQTYSQSGTYNDEYTTASGCDSIHTLVLSVNSTALHTDNVNICDNENYAWHNQTYTQSGNYYDTLSTIHGCDSICVLNLTVRPAYLFEEEAYACNGVAYNWHGHSLTVSGLYYDTLHTAFGCDSIYQLALTVYEPMISVSSVTICQDESYLWNGTHYTQSGEYITTHHNGFCDSTAKLILTVKPKPHTYCHANICQGEHYEGYGFIVEDETTATPGNYTMQRHIPTADCDSLVTLVLTVNAVSKVSILDSVWRGQPYLDNGFNISVYQTQEAGEYHYQFNTHNAAGCDSIVTLTLLVISGTNIESGDLTGKLTLYPNPVQDMLHIAAGCNINEIAVYDLYGKAIVRQQTDSFSTDIAFSHLPNGVYMIRIVTNEGTTHYKVVKQ